ncbi:MAG: anti-sigma factor [Microbacteriaceae bacterium]
MTRWLPWRRNDDEATCAEVAGILQHFLDGQVDDMTAQRVRRHLEACRRCGLEAQTYTAIKDALARHRPAPDDEAVERLRAFGEELGGDLGEVELRGESDSSS